MTAAGRVLVVNRGSSSVKLRLLDSQDRLLAQQDLEGSSIDDAAFGPFLAEAGSIAAVGHRIVHGGMIFRAPVLLNTMVFGQLETLADLAPLHQPPALATAKTFCRMLPGVPEVACFDTAFHAGLPAEAAVYALPAEWRRRWDLRRFGFHGLSHAYASRRCAELLEEPLERLRIVTCHLGSGASLAAVAGGRCIDTTMGFTPLEGLVMATRSGSVDPGLLLWLLEPARLSLSELSSGLERSSGLLGLCGQADMRAVLTAAAAGDEEAALAIDVYAHRLRASIASMAASMNGFDALVFTGGVGENSPDVRRRACDGLSFLGLRLDPERNGCGEQDLEIGDPGAAVHVVVVAAREDLEIVRQVRVLLGRRETSRVGS